MTLDTKVAEVTERLEKLAVTLGEDFLKGIGKREKVMSLYGHEPEILDFIKEKLEGYFTDRGIDVVVKMGNDGYAVDVGYFTSSIFAQ